MEVLDPERIIGKLEQGNILRSAEIETFLDNAYSIPEPTVGLTLYE